jgi:carbonic anhydrase/acetyltransferase-like protein (isoleucine patch superfamily)
MHHPTAFVHPSARLVGPVLLAAGARVEDDAVIVGPATIGQRSIVGSGAIVTRSFVWDDCVVGDGAIVDSSVLADRSLVTPGEHLKNVTHLPEDVPLQPRTAGSRTPSADLMPGLTSATEVLRTGFAAQAPAARAAQR